MEATDDDGNHLTIEELKDQILVILFAGKFYQYTYNNYKYSKFILLWICNYI